MYGPDLKVYKISIKTKSDFKSENSEQRYVWYKKVVIIYKKKKKKLLMKWVKKK